MRIHQRFKLTQGLMLGAGFYGLSRLLGADSNQAALYSFSAFFALYGASLVVGQSGNHNPREGTPEERLAPRFLGSAFCFLGEAALNSNSLMMKIVVFGVLLPMLLATVAVVFPDDVRFVPEPPRP
jgi:hypothetical protein